MQEQTKGWAKTSGYLGTVLGGLLVLVAAGLFVPAHGQTSEQAVITEQGAQAVEPSAETSPMPSSPFNEPNDTGGVAHILPHFDSPAGVAAATDNGPLLYHGGPILTRLNIYSIFWSPAKLQSGVATGIPTTFQNLLNNFAADYLGHSISSVLTQYYQTVSNVTTYFSALPGTTAGTLGEAASYVDTNPLPASTCANKEKNCLADSQVQAEVQRIMTLKGWTGGLTKIFLIFLPPNEDTCLSGTSCYSNTFCAYHGHFTNSLGVTVIYANLPYEQSAGCQLPDSPNNYPTADADISTVSHEVSESITDPEGNAWGSALGNEIGDLCNLKFGTNTWDLKSGTTGTYLANQKWNGHFYEIQAEYDNHYRVCAQYGP
jgi:hypothetical protein